MPSEPYLRLRRLLGIVLTCSILLAGICLMAACVGIYRSGDAPFSREAVAAAFGPIAVPVYLCLLLVVLSFAAELFFPLPAEKQPAPRQLSVQLRRACLRYDTQACGSELRQQLLAERTRRKKQFLLCAGILMVSAGVFLVYATDGSHFHTSDINGSMIRAMYLLVPCLAVSFAACLWAVAAREKSILRELELLKQCPKHPSPIPAAKPEASAKLSCFLLAAAIGLAALGFLSGGTADVLTKAVNICTECIGLG